MFSSVHALRVFLFSIFCFLFSAGYAQQAKKHTISGYVKDDATGEYLIGANVYIKELVKGSTTNQYGFYSLTVDDGNYTLVISFIGLQEYTEQINLTEDKRINVSLKSSSISKEEVVITGERSDKNTQQTQMGVVEMPIETIKQLPAFMGEVDVLKVIQLLPGVKKCR